MVSTDPLQDFAIRPQGLSLFTGRNRKTGLVGARVHLQSSNFVYKHNFGSLKKWHGLFLCGTNCWGTLFSDRNAKTGPDRARVHLESSKLVCGHIFAACKNGMVYFFMAPSVRVLCLVTETQKRALTELGST